MTVLELLQNYCRTIKKNLPEADHKEMARIWLYQAPPPETECRKCVDYINDPATWE